LLLPARNGPGVRALWQPLIATVKAQAIEAIVEPTLARWFPEGFPASNPKVMIACAR